MVERRWYPRVVPAALLPFLLAVGMLALGLSGSRVDPGSVIGRAAPPPPSSAVVLPGTGGVDLLGAARPQTLPLVRTDRGAPLGSAAVAGASVDGRGGAAFRWWLAPSLLTGLLLAAAGVAVRRGRAPPAGPVPA